MTCTDSFDVFYEVMDASEDGKIVYSEDGVFLKANKVALDCLYPLSEEDISSISLPQFFDFLYDSAEETDESTRRAILERLKGVGRKHESNFLEVLFSQKLGVLLVEAKRLPSGATLFTCTCLDQLRLHEENVLRLSRFNEQLLQAIETVTTGVLIVNNCNKNTPVLFVNDAFCRFMHKTRTDMMVMGWDGFLSLTGADDNRDAVKAAFEKREEVEVSIELPCKKHTACHYTFRLSPVAGSGENTDLFVGILTDVTLLKQRETEFFHSQKLESLGQLAAGVAHDFNNILSIIGGYSMMAKNFVKDHGNGDARLGEFLEKINAASERGAGLTRKMLTFSRHKVVTAAVVNVSDVVREQQELLVPLLGVHVSLDVSLPEESMNIKGSADSLGQIVMNLAVNARDAMLNGGDLRIEVASVDAGGLPDNVRPVLGDTEAVVIRVIDDGMGMDRKTLERIFDPFFTTKDQGKGTGLGLSVVYGLVNEMGGVVDVSSVLHEGTTMSCYLPRSQEEVRQISVSDEADLSTICLDGYTALVAEDEPDLLILVTNMLEDMGLRVIGAENGNKALELADMHEDEIDILLTDVVMPEVNGVKLAELVNALNPDIKVIFMSGYPATGDMAPVELPDDIDFISKPVDYDQLAAMLLSKLREGVGSAVSDVSLEFIPQSDNSSQGA